MKENYHNLNVLTKSHNVDVDVNMEMSFNLRRLIWRLVSHLRLGIAINDSVQPEPSPSDLLALPNDHARDGTTDHLEPNDSPIDSHPVITAYFQAVAASLRPKTDRKAKAVATITCLPSFEREWMLCLECSRTGHYTIYAATADQAIWRVEETKAVSATRHQTELSEDLGSKLREILRLSLLGARHPETSVEGLDGVSYHFSLDHMSGKTWSPSADTLPGKLCALANELYKGTVAGKINERRVKRIVNWFSGKLPGFDM